jgi:membrane-associated protease RseP (regulator of RpoE activity)
MKLRLLAAALALGAALPAAGAAQENDRVEIVEMRPTSAWMGIRFGWEDGRANEARVDRVMRGSPAERAGVREGDVVVRLNGAAPTEDAVERLSRGLDAGDTVRLVLRQGGREREVRVIAEPRRDVVVFGGERGGEPLVLGDGLREIIVHTDTLRVHLDSLFNRMDSLRVEVRQLGPEGRTLRIRGDSVVTILRDSILRSFGREPLVLDGERLRVEAMRGLDDVRPFTRAFEPRAIAGAELAEMNRDLGRYFRTERGLLVLQVSPSTPASRAGLEAGDVVVKAEGRDVETVSDLREAFSRADDGLVRVEVIRQGRRRALDVRWERATHRYLSPGGPGVRERVRVAPPRPRGRGEN